MRFRPCIDLHEGEVKQIVGSTLESDSGRPQTNFVSSERSAADFAALYAGDNLDGGHVIKLGPGNDEAAAAALAAFPGGLHLGGGVSADNAGGWLSRGAAAVVVTSYVFSEGQLNRDHLEQVASAVGKDKLVLDLSCARRGDQYVVATDRWRNLTDFVVDRANLEFLADYCCEFLVHATEREGKQAGIDAELVRLLGSESPIPTVYAGGISSMEDIETVKREGEGRLDFTVGSALDIFGGSGVRYDDMVELNRG